MVHFVVTYVRGSFHPSWLAYGSVPFLRSGAVSVVSVVTLVSYVCIRGGVRVRKYGLILGLLGMFPGFALCALRLEGRASLCLGSVLWYVV